MPANNATVTLGSEILKGMTVTLKISRLVSLRLRFGFLIVKLGVRVMGVTPEIVEVSKP